jgi:hypothetical protein
MSTAMLTWTAAGRNGLDDRLIEHALLRGVLGVHDRRFGADRHRFLDGAHSEVGIHRGDERAGELYPVLLDDVEAGQGEGDRVGPGRRSMMR